MRYVGIRSTQSVAICVKGYIFVLREKEIDTSVYDLFVVMGRICVINDVYLHKYQVLDYGLICKNNPKWGLVSLASGPDGHLIRHPGLFPVFRNEPKRDGAPH
jgi:hypothetical protein